MSVILSSTTDSPEEVSRAMESAGMPVESLEVLSNEPEKVEDKPKEETKPAPAESPAVEAGKPGEGESADESGTTEETEESEEQVNKKKGSGAEKKIDKLTREKAERDGRIAELNRQLEELKQQKAEPEKKPAETVKPAAEVPKPVIDDKPKPKLEDFESHEEWLDALTDWKAERRETKLVADLTAKLDGLKAELAEKEQKNAAQTEAEIRREEFDGRVIEAKERYSDWDEVSKKSSVDVSPAIQDLLLDLPDGPDVLYYLATHPEEAAKVLKATSFDEKTSTPRQVTRAIAVAGLEYARISALATKAADAAEIDDDTGEEKKPAAVAPAKPATPPTPKPKVSAAPAPIKPTKGAATAVADTPYEKSMSHKEYMEWYSRTHPRRSA